jgi:two-component system, cell cycle response regulator DivK
MPRCLLIDDDGDSREAYAEYLRGYGYDVTALGDSRGAMADIAVHRPAIVLLDLQMPFLDGFELLRRIKTLPGPALPVVVISACAYPEDRARAAAARCDAFLAKPATPDEVLATIRQLVAVESSPS